MIFQVARPSRDEAAATPPGRLVLLGHPVSQSRSPIFQNAALTAIGSSLRYTALDVPVAALPSTLDGLIGERAAGNVTVPHKEAVFSRCARHTPMAARVGAVNCFWTEHNGLVGDNTDVAGIRESLTQLIGAPGRATFGVRLLGSGGSAAAVLVALADWPGARISVWGRTSARAEALCARVSPRATIVDDPATALNDVRLVINATPIGFDGSLPPVEIAQLAAGTAVFDLVYVADETQWVRAARARGLRALDGLRMLVEQGAVSFGRWFGREPDRRVLWRALGVLPPHPANRHRWL